MNQDSHVTVSPKHKLFWQASFTTSIIRMYHFLGKQVRVHLYSRDGIAVGTVTGRVADIAEAVEVSNGMKKDLVLVVDIQTGDPEAPYKNSAGMEGESWFAVQDIEVIQEEGPRIFSN